MTTKTHSMCSMNYFANEILIRIIFLISLLSTSISLQAKDIEWMFINQKDELTGKIDSIFVYQKNTPTPNFPSTIVQIVASCSSKYKSVDLEFTIFKGPRFDTQEWGDYRFINNRVLTIDGEVISMSLELGKKYANQAFLKMGKLNDNFKWVPVKPSKMEISYEGGEKTIIIFNENYKKFSDKCELQIEK